MNLRCMALCPKLVRLGVGIVAFAKDRANLHFEIGVVLGWRPDREDQVLWGQVRDAPSSAHWRRTAGFSSTRAFNSPPEAPSGAARKTRWRKAGFRAENRVTDPACGACNQGFRPWGRPWGQARAGSSQASNSRARGRGGSLPWRKWPKQVGLRQPARSAIWSRVAPETPAAKTRQRRFPDQVSVALLDSRPGAQLLPFLVQGLLRRVA